MRKITLATLLVLIAAPAFGQIYLPPGVGMPPQTVVGNTQSVTADAVAVPITSLAAALNIPGFANPSASIGLTANNGAATTAMRSDATPALSQSIAPTWTGKHTWTSGGVDLNGTPPLSATFTGSGGSANFWLNQRGSTASNTVPEIGAQFTLSSNTGFANRATAYKIGLTSSVVANTGSADIYAANMIAQGYAGPGGNLIHGLESDINNLGADATTLGANTGSYAFVGVAAGSFKSTAAFWATSVTTSWQYGFATSVTSGTPVSLADFYSGSSATNVLHSDTTHSIGINFFSATITNGLGSAFISPNNVGFGSANAAGNATIPLVYLDGSNVANHGSTSVVGHKFAGNPGGASAFMALTNSHATAGDIVLQLQGGAATAVDTTTLYVNMVNPGNTIQRGAITSNDSAGVGHVAFNTSSDERLKKSLGILGGAEAIARLMKIEVHRYQGRNYAGHDYDVGFFAQNLHKSFPWAVTPSDDPDFHRNPWQVDYGRVTPLLVAAIQDTKHEIDRLAARITALEQRNIRHRDRASASRE